MIASVILCEITYFVVCTVEDWEYMNNPTLNGACISPMADTGLNDTISRLTQILSFNFPKTRSSCRKRYDHSLSQSQIIMYIYIYVYILYLIHFLPYNTKEV